LVASLTDENEIVTATQTPSTRVLLGDVPLNHCARVAKELENVKAEISQYLMGYPPKWKKYDIYKCPKCTWEGSTHLMIWSPTIMGGGHYPSTCPKCSFKSQLFGKTFDLVYKKFEIVEADFKPKGTYYEAYNPSNSRPR